MKRFRDMDFILVGLGLAGGILAHQLIKAGKKIVVYNTPEKNHSSMVAAGLFNPITGRRLIKTWKADLLFPFLTDFYRKLEYELDSKFFHQIPIFRPFLTIEEKNQMISNSNLEELDPFIDHILHSSPENFPLYNDLGGLLLKNSGFLNISSLIKSLREFVGSHGKLREEIFVYEQLEILNEGIRYKDTTAKKIIFCEGPHAGNNPFFNWLPFRPVKGEILLIDMKLQINFIYNRKIFLIPYGEGSFKLGSTYSWDYLDVNPTEDAKKYLVEKLNQILTVRYKVIEHLAGIRPATQDRRPFLGMHPDYPSIGVFNGLGSKGVSLAPYFAHQFVGYLLKDMELDKEVNIKRYY